MAPVEIRGLYKRFGSVEAVRGLSFDIAAGRVTGFLGPNGAGKSTTLRALLGLVRPTQGTATFAGRRYDELDRPSAHVGAVLEDTAFHPGRTARNHLRVLAITAEHPPGRVESSLAAVDLSDVADRRLKGFSYGMRQRLAIAAALLGDPEVLILDEPTNGLDPPGIRWMRDLLRAQAAEGRTVLVSSHALAEVAQSVDDVVVIANGELKGHGTLSRVLGGDEGPSTEVRVDDNDRLTLALTSRGYRVVPEAGRLLVPGATPEQIGAIALQEHLTVFGLAPRARSLEAAFFALTGQQA